MKLSCDFRNREVFVKVQLYDLSLPCRQILHSIREISPKAAQTERVVLPGRGEGVKSGAVTLVKVCSSHCDGNSFHNNVRSDPEVGGTGAAGAASP